jgi:hypothetical protein
MTYFVVYYEEYYKDRAEEFGWRGIWLRYS